GKVYFGNANFTKQVIYNLEDMPETERSLFLSWLNQSPLGKLWQ
ncbi:Npun_F0813 family protein, partial [Nostoc sp.]